MLSLLLTSSLTSSQRRKEEPSDFGDDLFMTGSPRSRRHNFIASWEKLSTAAERSPRITQLAIGTLHERPTGVETSTPWGRYRGGEGTCCRGHRVSDVSRPVSSGPRGAPGAASVKLEIIARQIELFGDLGLLDQLRGPLAKYSPTT
jgi:hypothetical protein